jgi:hypothetical protein
MAAMPLIAGVLTLKWRQRTLFYMGLPKPIGKGRSTNTRTLKQNC